MPAPRLTPEQVTKAAEMRERGLTEAMIGRRLGVSTSAISWRMLQLGVEPPNPRPLPPVPTEQRIIRRGAHAVRRFTEAEDRQLIELEAKGLGPTEIGRRLGRRHNAIVGRLMTLARREARSETLNATF